MELTLAQQSQAFLYSILLGVVLGAVYGVFKILRLAFCRGKIFVFAFDFVYMLIFSLSIFYFSLAFLYGYIRIYIYIGSAAGFLIYRLTIGMLFSKIYGPIIDFCRKISSKIRIYLKKFAKKVLKITHNILYNVFKKKLLKDSESEDIKVIENNEKDKHKNKGRRAKQIFRRK